MASSMLEETEIAIFKKKICAQYMCGMVIVLSIFTFYYYYADIKPLNYLVSAVLVTHIFFIFIIYILNFESLKLLIPVYLVYISVFLYVENLFFLHYGQIIAFLWYILIPMAATVFFERKKVINWIGFVSILIASIFIITPFIPDKFVYQQPDDSRLAIIDIITVFITIIFVLFFIYYQLKLNQIKKSQLYKDEEKDEAIKDLDNTKFDDLYSDILDYFSKKRPYRNPDFTIVQLANDLNSNVKYISTAIKIKENVSFKAFLNKYRINLAKEKIEIDYHNNLKYLYIISGFRHQSTFNRVFKDIEGITPSEYIIRKQCKIE